MVLDRILKKHVLITRKETEDIVHLILFIDVIIGFSEGVKLWD